MSFPINSRVIFHSFLYVYQRVYSRCISPSKSPWVRAPQISQIFAGTKRSNPRRKFDKPPGSRRSRHPLVTMVVTISWRNHQQMMFQQIKQRLGLLTEMMVSYGFILFPKPKKVNTGKKKRLIWWLERCNKWWSVKWPFLVFVAWLGARNCWVIWCKNINHQPFCWIYIYIYT